jgi:hypothetical protein
MPMPLTRPVRTLTAVAIAAAAALGMTACGSTTIKTDEVEATIVKQFAAQGVKVTEVSCESGVEAKVDAPINCTALNPSETKLILEGKVTSVKDDKGSFQVKAVRGIAKGPVIATQARTILERKVGQKARSLTCPDEVPIPTKPTVTCELTARDGSRVDTTVTIDAESNLSIEVADTVKK